MRSKLLLWLACAAAFAGSMRLFQVASLDSTDFHVYWKAVQAWFTGSSPYAILPQDHGLIFKYPPWLLPLLMPLRWLSFPVAKGVWASLELLALFYCVRWLSRHEISARIAVISGFLYWYLWMAHFYSGQITLFLLASALWTLEGPKQKNELRSSILFTVLSTKIFSLFSWVGLILENERKRELNSQMILRQIKWLLGIFLALNFMLLAVASLHHSFSIETLTQFYQDWRVAAGSGGIELGAEVVRGHGNHSFTAALLRQLDPSARHLKWDILLSLLLALGIGTAWHQFSASLKTEERWAGWLALGVTIHPLAWHHSFVLALPLSAYSLQAATQLPSSVRKPWLLLALLGTALITLLLPETLGPDLVKIPETLGNKSWGVILCAWVLVQCRKRKTRKALAPKPDPTLV